MIFTDPTPDAPELAQRGDYGVGVRTLTLVNDGVVDVLAAADNPEATIDREVEVEIWYPAIIPAGEEELTEYTDSLIVEDFTFLARALRDAEPDTRDAPYPLIVMAHGLGGNRLQMSHLGDHLAAQGYVVVAIDHADGAIGLASVQMATTYRPQDILFTLDQMEMLNEGDSFLAGLVDVDNTGLIGYSYGGYGALVVAGAGITEDFAANPLLSPGGAAQPYQFGNVEADERVQAVFAFAPFGYDLTALSLRGASYWADEALAAIERPLFILAGSEDDVAEYDTGIVPVFEKTVNTDRHLLTLLHARHNVAVNPSPPVDTLDQYMRYGEPVWRSVRLNNIAQHFVTAFMGLHLKGLDDYATYLDLPEVAREDTPWAGFLPRTNLGMTYQFRAAGE